MAQWPPSSEIAPHTGTIVSSSETPAAPEGLAQPARGQRSERASRVPCPWRRRRERHTSGGSARIWGSPAAGPRANGQHPYVGGRRIASCTSAAAPDRPARTLPGAPAALRPRTLRRVPLLPPDRGRDVGGHPAPPTPPSPRVSSAGTGCGPCGHLTEECGPFRSRWGFWPATEGVTWRC